MAKIKNTSFKVRDLLINLLPETFIGNSNLALCTQNMPTVDTCGRLSPVAIPDITNRIAVLENVDFIKKLNKESLNELASDIGMAVIRNKMALCAEDMPTCGANDIISPYASGAGQLDIRDLGVMRVQLRDAMHAIESAEKEIEIETLRHRKELLPHLEAAVKILKSEK